LRSESGKKRWGDAIRRSGKETLREESGKDEKIIVNCE